MSGNNVEMVNLGKSGNSSERGEDVELTTQVADKVRMARRQASLDLAQQVSQGNLEAGSSAEIIRTIKNAHEITNEVMEEVPFVKYNRVPTSVEQIKYSPEELIQTTEKTVVSGAVDNKTQTRKIDDLYQHDPEREILIEVPHIQQRVRTNVIPEYEEEPMLVEVPMVQIRAVPKEYIIDRTVPIPVEVSIVQEILCPELIPEYTDIPVPVHVTRVTEKPVPKDALISDTVLKAAIQWHDEEVTKRQPNMGSQPPHLRMMMDEAIGVAADGKPTSEANGSRESVF